MSEFKFLNIKDYCAWQKDLLRVNIEHDKKDISLAIIQVGNVEASNRYIKNKIKDCEEVGITAHWYNYSDDIKEEDLIWEIKYQQQFYTGIIVQVPLPAHISQKKVAEAIDPKKDVDGFHPMTKFRPCTPFGIYEYLGACGFQFSGSNVAVIGRSDIVGKPMAKILTDADATVTLCHSKTKNLDSILRDKDLIVCSVGKPNFLNCYSLHMPIVDVGINFNEQGKMVGDCFNTEGRMVTPVPGGVGLLTRVALLENLWEAAKNDGN